MKKLKKSLYSYYNQPFRTIQKLRGVFHFPRFDFNFIRIQGSPGAHPASIAMVTVAIADCGFPDKYFATSACRLATADFLIRRF